MLNKKKNKNVFLFEKTDWSKFGKILQENNLFNKEITDINESERRLTNIISRSILDCVPIRKCETYKKPPLPNFILDLISAQKREEKKYLKSKKENLNPCRKKLDYFIHEIRYQIIDFESQNWLKFLNSQGANSLSSKPFWKRINRYRNKANKGIPTLLHNGVELKSDSEKVLAFDKKSTK